jgi:hypothetical protein
MKHLTWLIGLAIFSASCNYEQREYAAEETGLSVPRVRARPTRPPELVSTARPAGADMQPSIQQADCSTTDETPDGWMSCAEWMNVRPLGWGALCDDFTAYCQEQGVCPKDMHPVARGMGLATSTMNHCINTPMTACDGMVVIDCCNDNLESLDPVCKHDSDCAWAVLEAPCRGVVCAPVPGSEHGVCMVQQKPFGTVSSDALCTCAFDGFCE